MRTDRSSSFGAVPVAPVPPPAIARRLAPSAVWALFAVCASFAFGSALGACQGPRTEVDAAGVRSAPEGDAADERSAAGQDPEAEGAMKGYRLRIRGNSGISAGALEKAIADELIDFERSGYAKFAIDDAAFVIEELYRSSGYPRAVVEYALTRPDAAEGGKLGVELSVEEGPRTRVEELRFEGLSALTDDAARAFFDWPRGGTLGTGSAFFAPARFSGGASSLQGHLRSLGYVEAKVTPAVPLFTQDDTSVRLVVGVEAGRLHRVVEFVTEGIEMDDELREAASIVVGRPYVPRRKRELGAALEERLARRGHPDVQASVTERITEDGSVTLVAAVEPGPRVTIGGLRIETDGPTRPRFIRSRLRLLPGQTFDVRDERESFRRLYATGLFRRVGLALEGEGAERDLSVRVEEADSVELFVEPGLGSYEGLRLRAGVTERNLFGSGRSLDLSATFGKLARTATIGLTDPWFLQRDLEGRISAEFADRQEPSYREQRTSLGTGVGHRFGEGLEGRLGLELSRSELLDQDVDAVDVAIEESLDLAVLFTSMSWDTRDQIFTPQRGGLSESRLEYGTSALGSDLDFVRLAGGSARFFELGPRDVVGFVVEAGVAWPRGGTDSLPLQERFFVGGERSVRAFREDELGRRDGGGDPLGGEAFTRFSLEWRRKLAGNLQGALFGDAGTVGERAHDILDLGELEGGFGLGLRYLLPIGPLRVDGAFPLGPNDDRADFVLHVSVGMPF